jgi:UDP-N-acetylglucosamine--N-acetylmuramyl-(pentapeptide) pyrophosphoryl-undecaprenol N-acetylglucosamine transferase
LNGGRNVLAAASGGGHFKQLVQLVQRIEDLGAITWLTYDNGLSESLLEAAGRGDDRVVFAPYATPRDLRNLGRDAIVARQVLREEPFDLAISTGAGLAVATLPLARLHGVRACFMETAARTTGPSLSGRILQRTPGIELFTQHDGYPRRWRYPGSVYDAFLPGPEREPRRDIRKIVVTIGTSERYGFGRLIERLLDILPESVEVLWQTGATDVSDLGIPARASVPGPELEAAMADADVIIAHAGVGSTLTAFELGCCPVLVPRRRAFGENVDDHQAVTASTLSSRGLALMVEADQLAWHHLETAAARTVVPVKDPPRLAI